MPSFPAQSRARLRLLVACGAFLTATGVAGHQRTVTAPTAWVQAPAPGATEAHAFAVVANSGMYEVYITGVACEEAAAAELWRKAPGASAPAAIKDVPVPAYDQLEMAPEGVHIRLRGLTRPLKAGDTVPLSLFLDNGDTLTVAAVVK